MTEFNGSCSPFVFKVLNFLGIVIGNGWDSKMSDEIANLIEKRKFKKAQALIEKMESVYGASTETVKLATRISRIEILGK